MRFVIADDMPPALRFMHRVIAEAGHDVVGQAENGRQAVLLCKQFRPDVVVLDNNMPEMTGQQAAEEISRERYAANIIFVTTKLIAPLEKRLQKLGCIVIAKTDEDSFLLRAIGRCKPKTVDAL